MRAERGPFESRPHLEMYSTPRYPGDLYPRSPGPEAVPTRTPRRRPGWNSMVEGGRRSGAAGSGGVRQCPELKVQQVRRPRCESKRLRARMNHQQMIGKQGQRESRWYGMGAVQCALLASWDVQACVCVCARAHSLFHPPAHSLIHPAHPCLAGLSGKRGGGRGSWIEAQYQYQQIGLLGAGRRPVEANCPRINA